MRTRLGCGLIGFVSWIIYIPDAGATDEYQSKYAPILANGDVDGSKEINSSIGGLSARPMIAAGRMGMKFWTNTNTDENMLFGLCPSYSTPGTTWKDSCDPMGLKAVLNQFKGQNWVEGISNDQTIALQGIYVGITMNPLPNDGSPVIVPLFGHPTHWGTLFKAGFNGSVMNFAVWFDSGPIGVSDGQFSYYTDGVQGADGDNFKTIYYKVIQASYLSPNDKYLGKYVYLYDPPAKLIAGDDRSLAEVPRSFSFSRSPGVLKPGEIMTQDIARNRVWEAISAAKFDQTPAIWSGIKNGYADSAWLVYGVAPSGEPMDYYLVSILATDGTVVGMARLSTIDGACQHVWAASSPSPYYGVTPEEALLRAQNMLLADEMLEGGQLAWDARIEEPAAPSPFFPYYSFAVWTHEGELRGRVLIMLRDGDAIFRDLSSLDLPAVEQPK